MSSCPKRRGWRLRGKLDLMQILTELAAEQQEYARVKSAMEQVRATGYGIVMPDPSELHLDKPEIVRKGSSYAVHLKASAPSIHLMRANIETELSPIVGDEQQSDELIKYLLGEYEGDTEKLWQSNIFGQIALRSGHGRLEHQNPAYARGCAPEAHENPRAHDQRKYRRYDLYSALTAKKALPEVPGGLWLISDGSDNAACADVSGVVIGFVQGVDTNAGWTG